MAEPWPDDSPPDSDHQHQQHENILTPMAALACQMHEWYGSFVTAGFSEPQALYLVAVQMSGGPKAP